MYQKIFSHILSRTSLNIIILKCKSKQNKRNILYNMTYKLASYAISSSFILKEKICNEKESC